MAKLLNGRQIREYIKNCELIKNTSKLSFSPASYELRIGSYFDDESSESITLKKGESVALMPSSFLLVGTVESVKIPLNILGMMYLRSSFARNGFVSWFQGLVDPGYSGGLTLALHNLSNALLPIVGHERVCHIVFQELQEAADEPYGGVYQGSSGATPSLRRGNAIKVVGSPRNIGGIPII